MKRKPRRGMLGASVAAVLAFVGCGARTDPHDAATGSGNDGAAVDCSACPTDELVGDLMLDSQAQVDSQAQYGSVTGKIVLSEGNGIADLEPLQCISSVGKSVVLRGTQLQSVSGLACLKSVAGAFQIQGASMLTNVDGLERLTEIGVDLYLNNLASLDNVDGLKGVRSVGRNLNIVGVPKLPTCDAVGIRDQLVTLGGAANISGTMPDACGP